MIRVRFAPSPTGYLHVGGARTALFNWLFARHHKGTFILRIEDTDKERSTDESIEEILESMRWLGLDWDEYYRQTDRTEAHLLAAQGLMDRGLAYEKDGAWWFRVPTEGKTVVHDDLLGDVEFPNDQLKDFVIRRSDGSFIYHFVVVVDDVQPGLEADAEGLEPPLGGDAVGAHHLNDAAGPAAVRRSGSVVLGHRRLLSKRAAAKKVPLPAASSGSQRGPLCRV